MKIILLFVCLVFGGIVVETICTRLKRANGGKEIPIHLAPYFVSLRWEGKHICGGAFIGNQHVLTAASCVWDEFRKTNRTPTVVTGTDYRYNAGVVQLVKKISPHPRFLEGNSGCDVAVITLEAPVEWNLNQNFIMLPKKDPPIFEYAIVTSPKLLTSQSGEIGLQQFTVRLVNIDSPLSEAAIYEYLFGGTTVLPQSLMKRDTGAPLVYNRRIIGIVSAMAPKTRYGRFYVNVFKVKTFIKNCTADEPNRLQVRNFHPEYTL